MSESDLLHEWKMLRQLRDEALKARALCPVGITTSEVKRDVLLQLASAIDHLLSWSPPDVWKDDKRCD